MENRKTIRRVLICGNYGIDNLGDDAILAGLLKLVSSTWPGAKATVMSARPSITKNNYKVETVSTFPSGIRSFFAFWFSPNSLKTLRALSKTDVVFLGGGGLFNDEKWQSVLIWFIQFFWFSLFRKPLVCIAQSIGPLNHSWSRFLVKVVFKYAKLVTVRDDNSAKLLSKMGISNAHVLADPAFAIGYESAKSRNKQDKIVLSIRPWQSHNAERVYKQIAQAIDLIFEKYDFPFVFLPFQTSIEDDRDSFHVIHRLLKNKKALLFEEPDDYLHALEIISRSRLVLGMRLHSIIFSTLATTPFVALSYSSKVTGYVKSIEMQDFLLDSKIFKSEQVVSLIEKALKNKMTISKTLEKEKMKKTYAFFEHEKLLKVTFN